MSDQALERFHRALIEEIQTQRPDYLTAPFTVAEIYQKCFGEELPESAASVSLG